MTTKKTSTPSAKKQSKDGEQNPFGLMNWIAFIVFIITIVIACDQ